MNHGATGSGESSGCLTSSFLRSYVPWPERETLLCSNLTWIRTLLMVISSPGLNGVGFWHETVLPSLRTTVDGERLLIK